jgi:cyclic-di-GMP phosphodiesterase TipF (flagellum assembly factor)
MTFFLFLLYIAAGGAAGYASTTMLQLGLPLSVGAGVLTTAVLSQIHVLVSNGSSKREIDARMQAIEKENRESERRMDVIEARTDRGRGNRQARADRAARCAGFTK